MSGADALEAVARAHRAEWARVVATPAGRFSDVDVARAAATARRRPQRVRSIRVLPRVLGLTRSRSRNSATPSSYDRTSSA